ncbi:hypothetical protein GQ42DRAFT_163544 [Ramicandelaber brevisporus]|nr:hypothetical protein GQ42DRAFT_163544 [Ramicandelaber brevisporus]
MSTLQQPRVVKVTLGELTKRLILEPSDVQLASSWSSFAAKVGELFNLSGPVESLSYVDEDGDLITFASDAEWREVQAMSPPTEPLKLQIVHLGMSTASIASQQQQQPQENEQHTQQQHQAQTQTQTQTQIVEDLLSSSVLGDDSENDMDIVVIPREVPINDDDETSVDEQVSQQVEPEASGAVSDEASIVEPTMPSVSRVSSRGSWSSEDDVDIEHVADVAPPQQLVEQPPAEQPVELTRSLNTEAVTNPPVAPVSEPEQPPAPAAAPAAIPSAPPSAPPSGPPSGPPPPPPLPAQHDYPIPSVLREPLAVASTEIDKLVDEFTSTANEYAERLRTLAREYPTAEERVRQTLSHLKSLVSSTVSAAQVALQSAVGELTTAATDVARTTEPEISEQPAQQSAQQTSAPSAAVEPATVSQQPSTQQPPAQEHPAQEHLPQESASAPRVPGAFPPYHPSLRRNNVMGFNAPPGQRPPFVFPPGFTPIQRLGTGTQQPQRPQQPQSRPQPQPPLPPRPLQQQQTGAASSDNAPNRERYAEQLRQLRTMGMTDDELNLEVLAAVEGNLERALDVLLN